MPSYPLLIANYIMRSLTPAVSIEKQRNIELPDEGVATATYNTWCVEGHLKDGRELSACVTTWNSVYGDQRKLDVSIKPKRKDQVGYKVRVNEEYDHKTGTPGPDFHGLDQEIFGGVTFEMIPGLLLEGEKSKEMSLKGGRFFVEELYNAFLKEVYETLITPGALKQKNPKETEVEVKATESTRAA